jgi:2-oxoglutarate ferredoxin oxidoreductase subunit delta
MRNNPAGSNIVTEIMPKIKIKEDRCKGCMLCVAACPKGLIKASKKLNKRGVLVVEFSAKDADSCTGCALCAISCPDCAIIVYK